MGVEKPDLPPNGFFKLQMTFRKKCMSRQRASLMSSKTTHSVLCMQKRCPILAKSPFLVWLGNPQSQFSDSREPFGIGVENCCLQGKLLPSDLAFHSYISAGLETLLLTLENSKDATLAVGPFLEGNI